MNRPDFTADSALGALGLLPEDEVAAMESAAKSNPELAAILRADRELTGEMAESLSVSPPPGLRDRVLNRIRQNNPAALPEGVLALVRAHESKWRSTPYGGVTAKRLYADRDSGNATWLLKMEPGSVYPPHRHTVPEHCYVIEGDVEFSDYALSQGDYGVAAMGSEHASFTTRTGCLLLIMNNDNDEVFH